MRKFKPNINRSRGDIDYNFVKELNLTIENEQDDYKVESYLAKNYAKKYNKGKFNFGMAEKGVKNLIVIPRSRKYQNQFGGKVPNDVRDAVAKARLRNIMRRIREGDY